METDRNNTQHKHDNQNRNHSHEHQNHEGDYSEDDTKYTSPDKYLAMEQHGVSYTEEKNHTSNSDYLEYDNNENGSDKFKLHNSNSRNSDAFGQDDYILRDNIDLDEDQSNSISADDAPDTNTTDETL